MNGSSHFQERYCRAILAPNLGPYRSAIFLTHSLRQSSGIEEIGGKSSGPQPALSRRRSFSQLRLAIKVKSTARCRYNFSDDVEKAGRGCHHATRQAK